MSNSKRVLAEIPKTSESNVHADIVFGQADVESFGLRAKALDNGFGAESEGKGKLLDRHSAIVLVADDPLDATFRNVDIREPKVQEQVDDAQQDFRRTASFKPPDAVGLKTVSFMVTITRDVQRKNQTRARRMSTLSNTSKSSTSSFFMKSKKNSQGKNESDMLQPAAKTWTESLIMDIVQALNGIDVVIRNDQVQVEFDVDENSDKLAVHFSDTADVGEMQATALDLAKNFQIQADLSGSKLRELAIENHFVPYDVVSAKKTNEGRRDVDDIPVRLVQNSNHPQQSGKIFSGVQRQRRSSAESMMSFEECDVI